MRFLSTPRVPSPTAMIAALALVLALGGTAIAAGPAAKITKSKVKTIAAKQVKKLAPTLEVANATNATNAINATNASNATNAQTAQNGLDTFGFATNDSGTITDSTMPGVTVSKTSNVYTYTFPMSVVDCVPVVSGQFSPDFAVIQSGTGAPNQIQVSAFGGTGDHQLIVTCP